MVLQQYIAESEKQYHLRLKTVVPLDDAAMDRIENCVAKYKPLSMSRPSKTILQRTPLDFPDLTAAEVYIIDMVFGLPAAPHVLRSDIRSVLNAPESFVFVRTRNEPGEIETERLNALADIEAEAERRGLTRASLLQDADYSDSDPDCDLFGTDYNIELLKYLASVEDERHVAVDRVENAPFKWLDLKDQDTANHNAAVKDAPFVTWKPKTKPEVRRSLLGSSDQSHGELRRVYLDGNGKKVILTRTLGGEK